MSVEKLAKLKNFSGRPGPVLLVIMDGVGLGKRDESDGFFLAKTPCLDELMKGKLYTTLKAHGKAVGMPTDDDMGNSEVGHNALGAGRVFAQGASLVNDVIKNGQIFKTPTWFHLVENAKKAGQTFHFVGLLSDGNVHAHIDHLLVILRECAKEGVKKVRLHVLLDGRDVYEKSSPQYLEKTEALLKELNAKGCDYRIASGGGRMVTTMDRYNAEWTIVKRGWAAHVLGKGRQFASAGEAVATYYKEDATITDQYLPSFVIAENGKPVGTIQDGDSVVFLNFRGDRAIELSRAFEEQTFDKFDRERLPKVLFAGMMQYDGDLQIPKHFLVNPPAIDRPMSQYICALDIPSFAISETQKFGHVTYFWNGNNSGYVCESIEKYVEIPSDKIRFDQAPRMKADEITDATIELLRSGKYKFGRLNYPNGDMVGHTGVPPAIIASVEAVDQGLIKILKVIEELKGICVILADHGNADEMFTVKNGKRIVSTAHSLNPVQFIIVDTGYKGEYDISDLKERGLANVASTLFNLLGYEQPKDYAPSLIRFKS
ncbi:MAG: 2,3-bisphosphoglycerate-independent phosphoglycerate mutase [Candidatus Omnitrophica bacterium]|nr:2,3-bisphosphoglycerate-independent phosphoglycerate mutase [Candidatus Omnitrophota bacterium]